MVEGVEMTVKQARELSLHERYKVVLPDLYGRPRPGSEPWYQVLRRIQGLAALTRHAIYEPIKRPGLTGEKQLVERLYQGEYVGATAMLISASSISSPPGFPVARAAAVGRRIADPVEQPSMGDGQWWDDRHDDYLADQAQSEWFDEQIAEQIEEIFDSNQRAIFRGEGRSVERGLLGAGRGQGRSDRRRSSRARTRGTAWTCRRVGRHVRGS